MGFCSPKPVPTINFSKRATPAMTPASCLTINQYYYLAHLSYILPQQMMQLRIRVRHHEHHQNANRHLRCSRKECCN
ncbi:hypothetical protein P692DRAFT_20712742 [Suillus brevipes Sb2]|nr:hypothetical protein P692DRAFT_20712742 [Suillus brevipes Sb2]